MREKRVICVVVGPSGDAQGGVASVIECYRGAGLFANDRVVVLSTFAAGSAFTKLVYAVKAWSRYIGVLVTGGAPVLHVHVSSHGSFWRKAVFIWTAKIARRRVIFHLHGGGFLDFIQQLSAPARALAVATIRRSDHLLCLTSSVSVWLRAIAPGIPVLWWPNPVPNAMFDAPGGKIVREPMLLYLGALLPAKGLDILLVAFAVLLNKHPDAKLVIGGAGEQEAMLRRQVSQLGLAESVSLPGWLGPEARTGCLRRARVLVLPSLLEAQPMVILEAMATSLPVVGTAVGGVPDLIADDRDGLLVPAGQPDQLARTLLRIWEDEALRTRLAARARTRVESRHQASHVCSALLAMYEELASPERKVTEDPRE